MSEMSESMLATLPKIEKQNSITKVDHKRKICDDAPIERIYASQSFVMENAKKLKSMINSEISIELPHEKAKK